MTGMKKVEEHYAVGNILEAIKAALGTEQKNLAVDELSAVDEFHIGGRIASKHFFPKLGLMPGQKILDVGAGIGGGARFAAHDYGVTVTGVDLTAEYIEVGNELNRWTAMEDRVALFTGDATDLDLPDTEFDGAFTMHVYMNIENKQKAFSEVSRVLKPGAVFGIYDVMKKDEREIRYPVPWATDASTSFVSTPEEYADALETAGFAVESVTDRGEFATTFFNAVMEKLAAAGGPPALGIHLLMGANAREKVENITWNLSEGIIAPYEIVSRKR